MEMEGQLSTTAPCILRDAELSDLPAILNIYNECVLNTTICMVYEPHTLEYRTKWFNERKEKGHPVIVVQIEDDVVGFGSYAEFRSAPAYKYSVENTVYLDKRCRGRGVSKLIMDYLIKHAEDHDFHSIVAVINATNTVSIKLHEKYGFELVGKFKEIGFKFGEWVDISFYQLILRTPAHPVDGNRT